MNSSGRAEYKASEAFVEHRVRHGKINKPRVALNRNDLNILGKRTLKYSIEHSKRPPPPEKCPTHSCGLQSHEFPDDAHTLLLPNHQLKRQRNPTRRAATTVPGTRRAATPQATFFSAPVASPLCPPPPDFHVRQVRPATVYAEPHALSILIDRHQNDQQLRAEFMRKRKNAGHLRQAFEIAGFDATVTEIPCGHSEANGSLRETHNPMVAKDHSFCTSCTPGPSTGYDWVDEQRHERAHRPIVREENPFEEEMNANRAQMLKATQDLHDEQEAKAAAAMRERQLAQQKYAEAEEKQRRLGQERVAAYETRGGQWVLQRERAAGDVRRTCSRHIMDSAIERIAGKREDKTRHAVIERMTKFSVGYDAVREKRKAARDEMLTNFYQREKPIPTDIANGVFDITRTKSSLLRPANGPMGT